MAPTQQQQLFTLPHSSGSIAIDEPSSRVPGAPKGGRGVAEAPSRRAEPRPFPTEADGEPKLYLGLV